MQKKKNNMLTPALIPNFPDSVNMLQRQASNVYLDIWGRQTCNK